MIKYVIFLSLLLSPGCAYFRPSFISEESWEVAERANNEKIEGVDGPTGGHFNSDGEWIPDNPSIPLTYRIPDIGAGLIFDARDYSVSPSLQIELVEFHTPIPYFTVLKLDFGVAYQRAYIYLGNLWTNIFEISTGGWAGWNFEEKDWSAGIGFTIIRF